MDLDESLMPPSAFLESYQPSKVIKDDHNIYKIGFDKFEYKCNSLVNTFSQTEHIRTASKSSATTESVISFDDFKLRLQRKKDKYTDKINSLKQQYNASSNEQKEIIENLNKQLVESSKAKTLCDEELNKMKYYITGIENRESWLQERQRLFKEIEHLEINCQERQAIIEGLKLQLSNMEKIQSMQERELEKDIVKSTSQHLSNHEIRYEYLLRTWRHKVLALMVQKESGELVVRQDKHQWQMQINKYQDEINRVHNELEIACLKLDSNKALLSSKDITIEQLKRDNDHAHQQIELLQQENTDQRGTIESIWHQMKQFHHHIETIMEKKWLASHGLLETLNRRLQYAASRLPMIQSAMIRSLNMAKGDQSVCAIDKVDKTNEESHKIRDLEQALLMINGEMYQLRAERDRLITQIEMDSSTFNERVNARKRELEDEMNMLHTSVAHLEKSLNKSLRECEIVKNENNRIKSSHDELLNEKYNETESLQAILCDSRNEISSLSLELGELKRVSAKEKQKLEEKIAQCEQTLTERENYWSKITEQLKAERNILKMTIRQEGILSKLKIKPSDSQSYKVDKSPRETNRKMESMMKEVEQLTNELLINDVI